MKKGPRGDVEEMENESENGSHASQWKEKSSAEGDQHKRRARRIKIRIGQVLIRPLKRALAASIKNRHIWPRPLLHGAGGLK
jgi:hypothetical protein